MLQGLLSNYSSPPETNSPPGNDLSDTCLLFLESAPGRTIHQKSQLEKSAQCPLLSLPCTISLTLRFLDFSVLPEFRVCEPVLTHHPQGHDLWEAKSRSPGNTNFLYNSDPVSRAARMCPEHLLSWDKADSQESQWHLCPYEQIIP